jgi:transposase
MARKRLSMRKIREVLRLRYDLKLSSRQIAISCKTARSTVSDYLSRARNAGLCFPLPPELDDTALERLLYVSAAQQAVPGKNQMPPMEYLHSELRRKGVTLQLLWYEYKQNNPEGYQYSRFCELYRRWAGKLDLSLRQEHRAGEKLFVDYAGDTIPVVNPQTGEIAEAQLFVAVLGASNYTFVEASHSQELPFWIDSHIHAFEYFDGVPEILVPDNLKSGVHKACRYEPDINPTYLDMAQHYVTSIIPARAAKPKDKAKAEAGVGLAKRWILAALRNRTFFSLGELNQAIREKLTLLNNRKFQKLDSSRAELFKTIEKPALKPLPPHPYEFARWKKSMVNIDYHIEVDRHYYSVPYQLVRKQVEVRFTATIVEILFKNRRVASHKRSYRRGGFTTLNEHRPKSHQKHLEWTPSRIIEWAGQNGPHTRELVARIIESKPHPEQGYRSSLGVIRLAKKYSPERLEAACQRALNIKAYSYKSVNSILQNGLDQKALPFDEPQPVQISHPNIRGSGYYH